MKYGIEFNTKIILGYEACKASCKWYYTFQSNDIHATDEDICKLDSAPGNCYNPTYYPFCTEDPRYSSCSKKQDEYIYFTGKCFINYF